MDMKHTTTIVVEEKDLDDFGYMPADVLMHYAILAGMERNRLEGGGMPALRKAFAAAWMYRRIQMEQFKPIKLGDVLEGFGSGRTMLETEILVTGELYCNEELVARCNMIMMPVKLKGRIKIKPSQVNTLYSTEPTNDGILFPRLEAVEDFEYPVEKTITQADCDANANHFASYDYAALICKLIGYWDKPYNQIKSIQIDYIKECTSGNTIKLGYIKDGDVYHIQSIHDDGRPCFHAVCEL